MEFRILGPLEVADGDRIQHYINGKLNMEGSESSLTSGKINLQSEGAEIYYRRVEMLPVESPK